MKLLGRLDDLWLDYSPDWLYRFVDDFWLAVSRKAYWKRLRKAIKNERYIDYNYMSRDLGGHIITSIHTVLNKYLSKDCFVDWNAHKVESDLYSMMGLARIQERDFFENEYSAKYKFKGDRKSAEQINPLYDKNKRIKKVDKELEYKKECRKELFSLLEKHIDILWR